MLYFRRHSARARSENLSGIALFVPSLPRIGLRDAESLGYDPP
jgi:hypothetical protein